MHFSILTINTKDVDPGLELISQAVRNATLEVLPAIEVAYSDFKKGTESKPVPVYIMDRRNEDRMAMISNIDMMKKAFHAKAKLGEVTAPVDQTFNPRFMILDTHYIGKDDSNEKYAVRIMISPAIPVSQALILDNIAQKLSNKGLLIATVFSQSPEKGADIEYVCRWENGRKQFHQLGREGCGLIGQYTSKVRISINQILSRMDSNIEVLMAPKDLVEMEALLAAHESSKDFMAQTALNEEPEYFDTVQQINDLKGDIDRSRRLSVTDPEVVSYYLRIYDPRELEKFAIRPFNERVELKNETWS